MLLVFFFQQNQGETTTQNDKVLDSRFEKCQRFAIDHLIYVGQPVHYIGNWSLSVSCRKQVTDFPKLWNYQFLLCPKLETPAYLKLQPMDGGNPSSITHFEKTREAFQFSGWTLMLGYQTWNWRQLWKPCNRKCSPLWLRRASLITNNISGQKCFTCVFKFPLNLQRLSALCNCSRQR